MSLHAIHHLKENRPAFLGNLQNNPLESKRKSAKFEHHNLTKKKLNSVMIASFKVFDVTFYTYLVKSL